MLGNSLIGEEITKGPQFASDTSKRWELKAKHELRVEVDRDTKITLKLVDGNAELFGTELAPDKEYVFVDNKFAIFTWNGCALNVVGKPKIIYLANETPMVSYVNIQAALDEKRKEAKSKGGFGPRVMIVGKVDSGKSTLARTLLNYSCRMGWKPTYVDLDVGQNSISVPGCISATTIDHPVGVEDSAGLQYKPPLVYFYGHTTPNKNFELYKKLLGNLSAVLTKRDEKVQMAKHSGCIINTGGWVDEKGYDLLIEIATTLKVDLMLVLGDERLFSQLKEEKRITGAVEKLSKSGGVVNREKTQRRLARSTSIKEYFYGLKNSLSPHQKVLQFSEIFIYRVGAPQAPSSALPIGTKRLVDPNLLVSVKPSTELQHCILAVSHGKEYASLLTENVAGFIFVVAIDLDKKNLTCLSPCPGPLPSNFLLMGSLKWLDVD